MGLEIYKKRYTQTCRKFSQHLLELNLFSKKLYEELAIEPGFDFSLEKKGILMYFKSEKAGEEEIHLGEKARQMGLDVVALSQQQVEQLEPGIELNIFGAVHYRSDAHLYPNQLMLQLISHLKKAGVAFKTNSPVEKFIKEEIQHKKSNYCTRRDRSRCSCNCRWLMAAAACKNGGRFPFFNARKRLFIYNR